MTPREFDLMLEGYMEKEAWLALLNRRAMNEKRPTVDSLLGRTGRGETTPEEAKQVLGELVNEFGLH